MGDAQGVGLAATQLGILQRLFVFELEDEGAAGGRQPADRRSVRREGDRRGGLPLARGRPRARRALDQGHARRASTPSGREVRLELEGLGARVVQHELDHLDGVLIIDRTDDEHRKQALGASCGRRPSCR